MKKDIDDVTEKLNVSKDEISSSDEQGNINVEIIDINMEVKRWYSFANLAYALLVGYVWVRHIIGNPASGNMLRLIGGISVLMVLCTPYAVKVEPMKANLPNLACMAGCVCCVVCTGDCWGCGMRIK